MLKADLTCRRDSRKWLCSGSLGSGAFPNSPPCSTHTPGLSLISTNTSDFFSPSSLKFQFDGDDGLDYTHSTQSALLIHIPPLASHQHPGNIHELQQTHLHPHQSKAQTDHVVHAQRRPTALAPRASRPPRSPSPGPPGKAQGKSPLHRRRACFPQSATSS